MKSEYALLPGHICVSVELPLHGCPSVKFLVRVSVPAPHDAEHVPPESQALHVPSTANVQCAKAM